MGRTPAERHLYSPATELIADSAGRHRLPSICASQFARAGGLMYYGPYIGVAGQYLAGGNLHRPNLKGTKPGDLPVQAPTK